MTTVRLVALALVLSAAPLAAHDMWIEPSSFVPETGKVVGLRLRVGQDFLGDPIPRDHCRHKECARMKVDKGPSSIWRAWISRPRIGPRSLLFGRAQS